MDIGSALGAPSVTAVGQATNALATASVAGVVGFVTYVVGVTVSANGAPAAAVLFTIADSVNGSQEEFYIPAAAFAPIAINYHHPLPSSPGGTITASLPALGVNITGKIALKYVRVWG